MAHTWKIKYVNSLLRWSYCRFTFWKTPKNPSFWVWRLPRLLEGSGGGRGDGEGPDRSTASNTPKDPRFCLGCWKLCWGCLKSCWFWGCLKFCWGWGCLKFCWGWGCLKFCWFWVCPKFCWFWGCLKFCWGWGCLKFCWGWGCCCCCLSFSFCFCMIWFFNCFSLLILCLICSKRLRVLLWSPPLVCVGAAACGCLWGCCWGLGCCLKGFCGCWENEFWMLLKFLGDCVVGGLGAGPGLCWLLTLLFWELMTPMLMFPAKDGIVFLSPLLAIILGTLLSLAVFLLRTASAVLFLAPPAGPGQPSQPSLVSRRSPAQVG